MRYYSSSTRRSCGITRRIVGPLHWSNARKKRPPNSALEHCPHQARPASSWELACRVYTLTSLARTQSPHKSKQTCRDDGTDSPLSNERSTEPLQQSKRGFSGFLSRAPRQHASSLSLSPLEMLINLQRTREWNGGREKLATRSALRWRKLSILC